MVSMTSLKYHTRGGNEHPEGSTYDADESEVDNLTGQRLAIVTPPKAKRVEAAAPATRTTAVAPMTTDAAPRRVTPSRARPRAKAKATGKKK